MSTINDAVAALRELPTKAHQGIAFEKLMVNFIKADPTLAQQYGEVYRWQDWKYNGGKADTGIDLVARRREDGRWTAIQCKFYLPTTSLQKQHLDSFFEASGRSFLTEDGTESFANRLIISTTDKWSSNAEAMLENQVIPTNRIGLGAIAESPINWDIAYPGSELTINLERKETFEPRPHQDTAITKAIEGFETHDRGKLIMACGTGKTFTALRLAERVADSSGGRARVLFLVPSIALLSQSLKEWTAQTQVDLRSYAVCSDTKVSRGAEDIASYDLEVPVSTNGHDIAERLGHRRRAAGLTVVFSTYQSLPAIHEAQQQGLEDFDLVICDEAHRTTGVTLAGEDSSHFVRVHDADYIKAAKRLYMTATPRLFDDQIKGKAAEHSAELVSMDDEAIYGPEFHRLGFGEAVERGLLTDYKVLVMTVDEQLASDTLARFTPQPGQELTLDLASAMIGTWNGLTKRSGREQGTKSGFEHGAAPMQRTVAFARDIKTSKQITDAFPTLIANHVDALNEAAATNDVSLHNVDVGIAANHVDGTMNAMQRESLLTWLEAPIPETETRMLTNARCLSEGVDVPALDAVVFFNPRNSMVDVVQSVGRVMRKAEGKDYGYIILPVAVPPGAEPSTVLNDNKRFRVVWQILNALRAHDDRFNAKINSIALNEGNIKDLPIEHDHVSNQTVAGQSEQAYEESSNEVTQMVLFSLEAWQEALYTKLVDKVGTRTYWEDWADDVADIAKAQITRINSLLDGADPTVAEEFERFVEGLRGNLNDSITRDEAVSMLSQHLITAPVFDALFTEHDFASHNPVSKVMQRMVDVLDDSQLDAETEKLEKFYDSVRMRAADVTSASGKQTVIKELYERFFKKAFRKQSEALGIVYTPIEIVDFILRAADDVSRKHFGKGLTDEDVHILDPFTGTGTFVVRLLQSGLIKPHDLARKYAEELHATEIMLLAYYVAAVNIETTYHGLLHEKALRQGKEASEYEPFGGIVLADTFQVYEDNDTLDLDVFKQNNARIERQKKARIDVIVGNPPYSAGQKSANDLNANLKYPSLDSRLESTYVAKSTGSNKNKLYDSYLRAFRWATDRIGNQGVIAFVSNGGWIEGNMTDGVRKSLQDEFSDIYVINLRGNQRTAGEQSRKEGGKIFGSGSRATIAIFIGVKSFPKKECLIRYKDIGDYLSTQDKLSILEQSDLESVDWVEVRPNEYGDWVSQRSKDFEKWPPLGDRTGKAHTQFFYLHSMGVNTARDAWTHSQSEVQLRRQMQTLIDYYEVVRGEFQQWRLEQGIAHAREADVNAFLGSHPQFTDLSKYSWNSTLKKSLANGVSIKFNESAVTHGAYRPFLKLPLYFDSMMNERQYQLSKIFPSPAHANVGIWLSSKGASAPFSCLATNSIPDLVLGGAGNPGQYFPRWTWEPVQAPEGELNFDTNSEALEELPSTVSEVVHGYRRVDNITDEIHTLYREALGEDVTKDDIFYFVYGQLHDPGYREAYAADLKKMLPHIETPTDRARFNQLARAGRELMELHIGYEDVEPWPLDTQLKSTAAPEERETWRVTKLKWKKVRDPETKKLVDDRTTMIYNPKVTIMSIPLEADQYMLGSRSALAWIIDRYQVKKDKASGIINDPNDWADEVDNPRSIVDLIGKVTRVAVETVRIVNSIDSRKKS
ncbi:DEAD/DEAH box helicase [Corynebacterium glutamicum]|uniref:DEAD/DEAH box helicase n=1 Tax=Corynebacterium glutamicum TaxID=1718 RepID=UPI00094284F9|nr:DEAD/DEAH box helicase [Corynebacterium glutamicum]OKX96156.1 damage-inducible protein [Corynebacterium glutamicum]TWS37413.1 damage-inducible protein [Corynebacterium glutamicum]